MQSTTMKKKSAFQLKILIQNQTQSIKHPLNQPPQSIKTSKFTDLGKKKKCVSIYVALGPSTTNHSHSKPITADRNLTTPNPHHGTATSTTKEKTKPSDADPHHEQPPAHTMAPPQDHEREKIRTPTPIHTKTHELTLTTVSTQRPREREERDE